MKTIEDYVICTALKGRVPRQSWHSTASRCGHYVTHPKLKDCIPKCILCEYAR